MNPLQRLLILPFAIEVWIFIFKFILLLILLVFAVLATPIWLIFKTKFNPWNTVLYPFRKKNKKEWA